MMSGDKRFWSKYVVRFKKIMPGFLNNFVSYVNLFSIEYGMVLFIITVFWFPLNARYNNSIWIEEFVFILIRILEKELIGRSIIFENTLSELCSLFFSWNIWSSRSPVVKGNNNAKISMNSNIRRKFFQNVFILKMNITPGIFVQRF